jgi:hypothetical protein
MTRDYGKVRAQFWDDDALRELSIEANYLALYLITSRHTNAIGCFRLPIAYILNDTRLDKKSLERALAELHQAGYAVPCERTPWIFIPNFLRHNPPENPNVWRKCARELSELPGAITAGQIIADELLAMAGEDRMCKDGSKYRVSDDEKNKIQLLRDGFDTLGEGLKPLPSPNLTLSKPTLPADAGCVRGEDPEFEQFWKTYTPPPNSKKPDARAAWNATAKARPPLKDLLRAVEGYNSWLADQSRKQNREYPKQHAATWLRGEVWNGFSTEAASDFSEERLAELADKTDRSLQRGKYAPDYRGAA